MQIAIGLIGILIGIVMLNWLSFKGWNMAYIAIVCAIIVAILNVMNPQAAYVESFMAGAANILTMTYPVLLTGSLFAGVFSLSGAAVTIARALLKLFAKKGVQGNRGCWVVSIVSIVFFVLMLLGGVDAMAVQVAILPVIISLMKECNMTRKGIPLLLMAGYSAGAVPFAPHMLNTIPMTILGTESGAFAIPGIVAGIAGLVICIFYSGNYFIRMKKRGENFQSMPNDPNSDEDMERPNVLLSLLPLVVIFLLFNLAKLQISICLLIGTAFVIPLYWKWIRLAAGSERPIEALKSQLNKAVGTSGSVALSICAVVGFAAVIQQTDVFNMITGAMVGDGSGSIFMVALIVAVCAGITANSIAGLQVSLAVMAEKFMAAGVSAAALHRVASAAAQTLDSLPTSAGVVMAHQISGVKLKDGYLPVAVVSIVIPAIRTLILCIFYLIYPGWV